MSATKWQLRSQTRIKRRDDIESLAKILEYVLSGVSEPDTRWPWFRNMAVGECSTHAVTIAEILTAIDEYVEHRDDDRTPTVDISEGVIRTEAGRWTLAEWARRIERKLDEAIARWEAK